MTASASGRQRSAGTYTIAQAAKRLGVSPNTAYRCIRDGTFPVLDSLGQSPGCPFAVLERFLEGPVRDEDP